MKAEHVNQAGRVVHLARFFISIVVVILSLPVLAAPYEWAFVGEPPSPSPAAACQYHASTNENYTYDHFEFITETQAQCYSAISYAGGSVGATGQVWRTGDSCDSGKTYNSVTGACEAPPDCTSQRGDSIGWQAGSSFTNTCVNGCTAVAYGSGFILADGTFAINYKFNGGECDANTGEEKAPAPCPENWTKDSGDVCRPDPGAEAPEEGEGKACEITKGGNCITFDPGVQFPSIPEGTDGLEESGPGKEGEKTGAGGTVVGGGGGAASSGQGKDLDGDGKTGSCDPATDANCSKVKMGNVQGGLTCDVKPSCDGDEVMCAILMQQYLQRCPDTAFEKPQLGETDQKLADIKAEFQTAWDDVKADAESYFSNTLGSGGSIPSRITSIFGVNVDFSLTRFLPYLAIIASLIVAMAWIIAAGIVLNRSG